MSKIQGLPDPQTAYQTLFNDVHARVFFAKLASFGYVPESEQQAQQMLTTAGKLRAAEQQEKLAADGQDPFAMADHYLTQALGLEPHTKAAAAQAETDVVLRAANGLMQDPALYNAVLSLKAAEASQLEAAFAGR